MKLALRAAALFCLSCSLGVAGSWSGFLVDGPCFENRERNVNPTDTLTAVDRDQNSELRYCAPSLKTKSFALVEQDGSIFTLDSAGNARVLELIRKAARTSMLVVAVTGEAKKNTITVDSISVAH